VRSLLDEARPPVPLITPRDDQVEDADACFALWQQDIRNLIGVAACGYGKTVLAGSIAQRHASEHGGRTLFLAHREELLTQTREKFHAIWPDADIGTVKAEQNDYRAPVVLGSVQTLANQRRLGRLLSGDPIGLVVYDECHHANSPTAISILSGLGCVDGDGAAIPGGPHLLGLTATPARADGKGLTMFERVAFERSIRWCVAHRRLVDVTAKRIQLAMDLDKVKRTAGDYSDGDLGRAMEDASAPAHIVAAYLEHAADRTAICFVPTLELAEQVADAFLAAGVEAAFIAGYHDSDHRRRLYARLRSGELRVCVSVQVLAEGFDEPSVGCAILARPTQSAGLYIQMAGRCMRQHPGKGPAVILDVVGVTKRHRLQVAADLLGASEKAREAAERLGIPIGEAVRRDETHIPSGAGRLVAEDVDLWAEFDQAPVAWARAGRSFVIQLPSVSGEQSYVRLREDDGQWVVAYLTRESAMDPWMSRRLGAFGDFGLAQSYAEQQATRMSPRVRKNPAHRGMPATGAQLWRLDRMGIRYDPALTKREASSLIDAHRQSR
jgi:superfamily II DNA or RNA helicase